MRFQNLTAQSGLDQPRKRWSGVLTWLPLAAFFIPVLLDFYAGAIVLNNPPSFASKRFALFWVGIFPLILLAYLGTLYSAWTGRKPVQLAGLRDAIPLWVRIPAGFVILVLPAYLFLFSPVGNYPLGFAARLGSLVLAAMVAAWVIPGRNGVLRQAALLVFTGAIFTAGGWLNQVTAYPFSLSWSEGNRFWDYSVLFGSGRYTLYPGGVLARPFISIGRQFLWAIPFLLPHASIWFMRFWDALTWILPALLLGWAVVAGLPGGWKSWAWKSLFVLWMFVFMAQGPIYAPLLVCAILVVVALRSRFLWLAVLLLFAAGYYAYISRWTWMYAPGLWAGMLALLEIDRPSLRSNQWQKLIRPVVLGLAGYVGGQYGTKIVSALQHMRLPGNVSVVVDVSSSVSRQPLLWDRLLPNPTYPPGILFGTLWAGLPLVLLLAWIYYRRIWRPNLLQMLPAVGIALAFLGVGTVISVKIGGGSNLHNLDMFWITIALIAAWAVRDLAQRGWLAQLNQPGAAALLCLALIGPVTYTVQYGHPLQQHDPSAVQDVMDKLRSEVTAASQTGQVLFIDQRQLLAFGEIQGVPLAPEYEKKLMMDQAMAGNAKYFKTFQEDIAAKRFVLIVVEPIHLSQRDGDQSVFAEENNAWVKWVSRPLLNSYESYKEYTEFGIQLLRPKP